MITHTYIMRARKSVLRLTLMMMVALLSMSCSSFLEEYSQDTDYVRSWEDLNELLIGSAYQPVFAADNVSTVSDNQYFLHFLSDELDEYPESYDNNAMAYDDKERVFGYFTWQARSAQNDTYTGYNADNESKCWTEYYQRINVANNIIYSASQLSSSDETAAQGIRKVDGEARFLRAYYYFMLVNLYGKAYNPSTAASDLGVPIKTSAEVEDKKFQRNTVQENYDLIVSDLLQAEKDLDGISQPSRYRADVTTVRLLLSRVYLYMQNWQQAADYAQKVISAHPALINLNASTAPAVISESSAEMIFSMGSNNAMECTANLYKSFTISDKIYKLYAADDLRRTKYMWTNGDFHGYTKFPINTASADSYQATDPAYYFHGWYYAWSKQTNEVSDKNFFRSSEAYLNLAEAEAYLGNDAEARNQINHLRQYRYATGSDYTLKSSGEQLIKDIRDERERELVMEGQRWFDLRRYAVNTVLPQKTEIVHHYYYYVGRDSNEKTSLHTFTLTPDDWGWTLNIPQSVLDFNTGMQNNQRGERSYQTTNL